ncbi:MAG: hypothetical protein Q9187_007162 [Circinaria calcarea]
MEQPVLCLRGGGADAKRREDRKRKFAHLQKSSNTVKLAGDVCEAELESGPNSKKKKSRIETKTGSPAVQFGIEAQCEGNERIQDREASEVQVKRSNKSQRFICFVGNLPFTATTGSISKHFAKVQPTSVRHRTTKDTGKSKGFAFLEFGGYDRMKTCLKLFHHSIFDDGLSPARKVNVELTAGGGGAKSKDRRTKLFAKNEKLNEERCRQTQGQECKGRKPGKEATQELPADETSVIHPSRRSRVLDT